MKVGVLGGSGFVGKHLTKKLIDANYDVVSTFNNTKPPEDLEDFYMQVDVENDYHLDKFFSKTDVVFYLIHSLEDKNVKEKEERLAKAAGTAMRKNGVKLCLYLGGPKSQSEHLSSREQTYTILKKFVRTSVMRCSAILGRESKSYKILRTAGKSLFKVSNEQMKHKTNPIYIDDLTKAILAIMKEDTLQDEYEIGGPSISYEDIINVYAEECDVGKMPFSIPISLNNPVVTYYISFWADLDHNVTKRLLESLLGNLEMQNNAYKTLTGEEPLDFRQIVRIIEKRQRYA